MIARESIQQILSSLDILEVIGEFVKLKKRGANYLGLCPFHNEKTPSFTVSPSKEIYKCFGCGKSGNTISFLMEHEKYSYVEALKWLAKKYNITIEETYRSDEQREQQQVADSLYIINEFARDFFTRVLFETEEGQDVGLAYFKERGFREEIIKKFQLGYSPEQRDSFTREAREKQFNPELLQKAGLSAIRNGQLVDNYRGRVIFPVHNSSGKVAGFGARILKSSDKAPKYINTPENEIYVKSKILYGSYFARQAIDKEDECLLVEGYTDVISLHQAGITNVVASGGTSLTVDQLRLVKKYTNNLTIIYDGDNAGVKAALRGLDLALEEGLNVKLVLIPDQEDPDSYVHKVGAGNFAAFVRDNKKDFILFQLEVALRDAGQDASRKSEVVNRMAETISRINKAEDFTRQQDYIRQCASILKIDEGGLHALVNKFIRDRIVTQEKKLPFEEAKLHEENARRAEQTNYDDESFTLLFKDELQEKEIARILVDVGMLPWDEQRIVAEYVIDEMVDETMIDNPGVLKIIRETRKILEENPALLGSNYFIYHPDPEIASTAVALLNTPYDESDHWRKEFSQSQGFQQRLFELPYEQFIETLGKDQREKLLEYLRVEEDTIHEEVESALAYLKLRKIRRMLLENQLDMEKPHSTEEINTLANTHMLLKDMEVKLTRKNETVVVK
jgi:DNA primase